MSSAKASGSDANGGARSHEHNQGNQDRKYTVEQKAAVLRIRKCGATDFYEILSVERSATDSQIKKAYRKQSLLTHPDKNGYDGSDEAFKMVSRAFQILSDEDKKSRYDKFGGDPDSRFNPGPSASSGASPFSGFSGGFGGMGGGGFGGPGFVFNMNGGPGFRVHQFGGGVPRRRPAANAAGQTQGNMDGWTLLRQLAPLLILFVLPLLSSLFSSSPPVTPSYRFDTAKPPHTMGRTTPNLNLNYFVNPLEVDDFSARRFKQLDKQVETDHVRALRFECENEVNQRERKIQDAQGWFFPDIEKMKEARAMELPNCRRFEKLRGRI